MMLLHIFISTVPVPQKSNQSSRAGLTVEDDWHDSQTDPDDLQGETAEDDNDHGTTRRKMKARYRKSDGGCIVQ